MSRELQLEGDIRQAIENYMGDITSGPWDAVVKTLATVITEGGISVYEASRLNLALQQVADVNSPDQCPSCHGVIRAEGMSW